MVRIHPNELDLLTQVVVSLGTKKAFFTGNSRLNGHPVSGCNIGDIFSHLNHLSGRFVAQGAVSQNLKLANGSGFPEVDI
jgi:hypothetical protein